LSEGKPTLLLELQQQNPFGFIIDYPGFEETLRQWRGVVSFEDVFILQISENLNYFVQSIGHFILLKRFCLFFKNVVEVRNQGFRGFLVNITDLFKSEFYCHVHLGIFVHGGREYVEDRFSQRHQLHDKIFDSHLIVSHQFTTLFQDKFWKLFSHQIEGTCASLENGKHQSKVCNFVISDHAEKTAMLHL
jgi:hypothetical protein